MFNLIDRLSKKISLFDASQIRKIFDVAKSIQEPLDLSIGQPDFNIPEPVKEVILEALKDNKTSYTATQGILPLREGIAEEYSKEHLIQYSPENILVSNGSANILHLLFSALFNPGDEILLFDPTFIIYNAFAQYHELNVHYLSESFTNLEIDNLMIRCKRLKAIIFANPSNPSGYIFFQEQLSLIAGLAKRFSSVIVVDEIYKLYDYEQSFYSMAKLLPDQTITVSGFSKSHAMTGLRVGYGVFPDSCKSLLANMAKLQQYSSVCAPQISQWGALKALTTPIDEIIQKMRERRSLVLKKLSDKLEYEIPFGAFYIFPKIPINSYDFVHDAMKHRLLLVPGDIFTKRANYIRISYAQPKEILEEGLDVLLELVEKHTN